MKKRLVFMLFISVLLISCGKTEQVDYGNDNVSEQDAQNFSGVKEAAPKL